MKTREKTSTIASTERNRGNNRTEAPFGAFCADVEESARFGWKSRRVNHETHGMCDNVKNKTEMSWTKFCGHKSRVCLGGEDGKVQLRAATSLTNLARVPPVYANREQFNLITIFFYFHLVHFPQHFPETFRILFFSIAWFRRVFIRCCFVLFMFLLAVFTFMLLRE